MTHGTLLIILLYLALTAVLAEGWRITRRWRIGAPATVDWRAGLRALPRRYLVDVHHVVARRPVAARMHMAAAGGLLAGSGLLLLGIVPALRASGIYWLLAAAGFALALYGALLVWQRRHPERPASLSAGAFMTLPVWLGLYAGGGLLVALGVLIAWPLGVLGLSLAAVGLAGLLAQFRGGPLRHALAGSVWLAVHPRPDRFGGGRSTALPPLDLQAPVLGAGRMADFGWNRLAGFDACIQCGRCEEACPAFAAGQRLNPKRLIQDLAGAIDPGSAPVYSGSPHPFPLIPAQAGIQISPRDSGPPGSPPARGRTGAMARGRTEDIVRPDTLWACTTCRACVAECPMLIEHVDAIVSLRRHAVLEQGTMPAKVAPMLAEMRHTDEPGGRPLAARADFAAGLDLPILEEGGETDLLLWLGEGAYDQRYGRTLRALISLLREAGQSFAILGAEERDCGDLARRLGDEATFQRLAQDTIATLSRRRFRRIVTADPHALHSLRNEYRDFGGHYEVIHHTALLRDLVTAGRLTPRRRRAERIAYHDPCYLARYNGETEAPRALLALIADQSVEMARHGERAMCCGGGGGSPVSDVPAERRIPDLRIGQARDVGAEIVAVACPGCTAMLEGVTGPRPEIRDIAELLREAV